MSDIVGSLIKLAQQIASRGAAAVVNSTDERESVTEFSNYALLRPPVLYEDSILRLQPEVTQSIGQFLLSVYCSAYLSAVNSITHVGHVQTLALMNAANDAGAFRDIVQNSLSEAVRSTTMTAKLTSDPDKETVDLRLSQSMYTNRAMDPTNLNMLGDFNPVTREELNEIALEADLDISKPVNVAVGRVLKVPLGTDKDNSFDVNVTCAILPRVVNPVFLTKLLEAFVSKNSGYIERWYRYRAGDLSFVDYVLGLDIIRNDRYLLVNDNDGDYQRQHGAAIRGGITSLLTGHAQMNVATAMFVISDKMARSFESVMHGKFANLSIRKQFFKATGSMVICIVDQMNEQVKVYIRGVELAGLYSFDQLKPVSDRTSGLDINAIMKAYKLGEQYNF